MSLKVRFLGVHEQRVTGNDRTFFSHSFATLDGTANFSRGESTVVLPPHVVGHMFEIDGLTLTPAVTEEGNPVVTKSGVPCFNARREAPDTVITYKWIGPSTRVEGLPPAPAAQPPSVVGLPVAG